MKAGVIYNFGEPEVIKVNDVEQPIVRPGCVLVHILASSINNVDFRIRNGEFKSHIENGFPLTLGFDIAGIVVETGPGATKFEVGDPVYGRLDDNSMGAYAEFASVPEENLASKPSNISFYEAATVPMAGLTALQALKDVAQLKSGMSVLINDATSAVGHFAAQIAKALGAEVTALCNLNHKLLIEQMAPDYVFDINTNFYNIKAGFDVVFDVDGNFNFLKSLHLLNKDGVYLTGQFYKTDTIHSFISTIIPGKSTRAVETKPSGKDLELITGLIHSDAVIPWVEAVYPLEAIAYAHGYAETTKHKGKIAIDIGS
jgi:NADPH:quinone reductase-like Zn-dependent oxidoreductase